MLKPEWNITKIQDIQKVTWYHAQINIYKMRKISLHNGKIWWSSTQPSDQTPHLGDWQPEAMCPMVWHNSKYELTLRYWWPKCLNQISSGRNNQTTRKVSILQNKGDKKVENCSYWEIKDIKDIFEVTVEIWIWIVLSNKINSLRYDYIIVI